MIETFEIKNIFKDSNTLVYVALSMLGSQNRTVVPELLYSLDRETLLKLITIFGGEKIYIPEAKEFYFFMSCAIAGYYKVSQNRRWNWIRGEVKVESDQKFERLKVEVEKWIKNAPEDEIRTLKGLQDFKTRV